MGFRDVLAALRAGWWLAVIGLLVGGLAALVVSLLMTPLYTAKTQLFVSTTDSSTTSAVFQGSQFSQERVTSYVQLLQGEELAARVADQLDLAVSPARLAGQVDVTTVPQTVLIDVRVTDASPQRAQQIAEAIGQQFPFLVSELETTTTAESPVRVSVVRGPELPTAPSSPRTVLNVVIGALVAGLVGAAAAIARAHLDRSVKKPEEAAEVAGAPVIGLVLRHPAVEANHVVDRARMSEMAEDYRHLRANLQFLDVDEPPKVIMVSSALPSEGKTTVVVNLALALAEAGRRVTVVEADLRRPRVSRYLGLVGGVGLTNILAGSADVEEVTQYYGEDGLAVIAAGPTPPNPSQLVASTSMAELLEKLRASNDFVLVDSPPILPVADTTGLSVLVDGVLLCVRYGNTRTDQLQQASAMLERVGAKTLGVILNIVPPRAEVASAFGHGYVYDAEASADR
ncbi:polysaccharide biosynthesis tyrosine autokinase [Geodermatophilus sp. YIM 151500]|uniref:polysaccharide biosynthesis tyrosine autokinase n=1 Tax=Geodermatophilus sp. YIM 151500 TaxID=2984531 RepID=UPI0021E4F4CF|nr:polysaccharide biosynthesis tyrosine autokinase [Geodermatophilus sp. YIM 151500]MCV2491118.1 polysaccharide biosynthesis tyrosine autokinase [Geodermatophilus sp. YIM 151500]